MNCTLRIRRVLGVVALLLCGCRVDATEPRAAPNGSGRPRPEPERLRALIVQVHPHDARLYTQGLLWEAGSVYESHGRYGSSGLQRYRYQDGKVLANAPLAPDLFGEGLALMGQRLIQLTWRAGVAIYYDKEDFAEVGRRNYAGEGWGLTWDGENLIMSNGSHVLTYRDPDTFAVVRRLAVLQSGSPRDSLNELEFVNGDIYANIYETDEIVRIDPESGAVTAVIDASGLLSGDERDGAEVLNGIAYLATTGRFLLTGKYWPKTFEVELVPAAK